MNRICAFALMLSIVHPAVADITPVNFSFRTTSGEEAKLTDYKGKWLLVNFWAPWCPACRTETTALNAVNARPGFSVIGVALDYGADERVVKTTSDKYGHQLSHIVAGGSRKATSSAFRQVGPVDFFPTSYLYDPKGNLVAFLPGVITEKRLDTVIQKVGR